MLNTVPALPDLKKRIASLQAKLGKGVAPPMQEMPDTPSGGAVPWLGGTNVASSWIEAMLLQLGAGLPLGYGRFTPEEYAGPRGWNQSVMRKDRSLSLSPVD